MVIATGSNITVDGKISGVNQRAVAIDADLPHSTDIDNVEIQASIKDVGVRGTFSPAIRHRPSQYGSAQPGTEMWSDGTTGTAGPHVFDGTDWNGYTQASGSTVTSS